MKAYTIGVFLLIMGLPFSYSQERDTVNFIKQLSMDKWEWMADKNIQVLDDLFHEKSMFVHIGGSWDKQRELQVIKSGSIWYKKADVHEVTVNVIQNTVILLNRIDLLAVVGGKELRNPFMVTEVYLKVGEKWKLGSLSFSKLISANP